MKSVVLALQSLGYPKASLEYPGYVRVISKKSGIPFACGTVNDEWDCNRDDDESAEPFIRLGIPETETDANKIAHYISAAIEKVKERRFTLKKDDKFFSMTGSPAGMISGFFALGIAACYSYDLATVRELQKLMGGKIVEVVSLGGFKYTERELCES